MHSTCFSNLINLRSVLFNAEQEKGSMCAHTVCSMYEMCTCMYE